MLGSAAVGWHMPSVVVRLAPSPVGGLAQVVGWLEHEAQMAALRWCLEHGVSHAGMIVALRWEDHFLAALGLGPFSVAARFVRAALDSVANGSAACHATAVIYANDYLACPPPGMGSNPICRAEYDGMHSFRLQGIAGSPPRRSIISEVPLDVSAQSGSTVSTPVRDGTGCSTGSTSWTAWQHPQADADEHAAGVPDDVDAKHGSGEEEHAPNGSLGSSSGEMKRRNRRGCRRSGYGYSEC